MKKKEQLKQTFPFLYKVFLWIQRGPVSDVGILKAYISDYRSYMRYSYHYNDLGVDNDNLVAVIMKYAHSVEKGFSMPEIRPGYGEAVIHELISQLEKYTKSGFDQSSVAFRKAQSVLDEYIRYHDGIEYDLGELKKRILPWTKMAGTIGGFIELSEKEIFDKAKGDFESCAFSRCSIRSYSPEPVPDEWIRDAVRIASKTPSACNRQCWHTYIVRAPELKEKVLALQNGNRGFGDRADFIAIITADMRSFTGAGERYGTYIDGGLYAMSFMYALHYKGIGACPLNWMVGPSTDRKLKKLLNLNDSENVIMMISAGQVPEKVRVAKSVRKEVDEQLTVL